MGSEECLLAPGVRSDAESTMLRRGFLLISLVISILAKKELRCLQQLNSSSSRRSPGSRFGRRWQEV